MSAKHRRVALSAGSEIWKERIWKTLAAGGLRSLKKKRPHHGERSEEENCVKAAAKRISEEIISNVEEKTRLVSMKLDEAVTYFSAENCILVKRETEISQWNLEAASKSRLSSVDMKSSKRITKRNISMFYYPEETIKRKHHRTKVFAIEEKRNRSYYWSWKLSSAKCSSEKMKKKKWEEEKAIRRNKWK